MRVAAILCLKPNCGHRGPAKAAATSDWEAGGRGVQGCEKGELGQECDAGGPCLFDPRYVLLLRVGGVSLFCEVALMCARASLYFVMLLLLTQCVYCISGYTGLPPSTAIIILEGECVLEWGPVGEMSRAGLASLCESLL